MRRSLDLAKLKIAEGLSLKLYFKIVTVATLWCLFLSWLPVAKFIEDEKNGPSRIFLLDSEGRYWLLDPTKRLKEVY